MRVYFEGKKGVKHKILMKTTKEAEEEKLAKDKSVKENDKNSMVVTRSFVVLDKYGFKSGFSTY